MVVRSATKGADGVEDEAERKGGRSATNAGTALESIVAFIPSEVIGTYIAGLGIWPPTSEERKWLLFGICVGLIPVFLWLQNALLAKKNRGATLSWGKAVLSMLFAGVSFSAWAAAMPDSPFLGLSADANQIGALAATVLALLLPKFAELFDLTPPRGGDGAKQ
jgi:hypothetical protein